MHQIQSTATSKPVSYPSLLHEFHGLNNNDVFFTLFLLCTHRNINNLDTSVPSIHSSGCDSGVGLTTQMNAGANKQMVQLMRSSQRENLRERMMSDKRVKRCVCGYAAAGAHVCNAGEESRYSCLMY